MFGSFECRLTPHINWGGANELLVYVERGGPSKHKDQVVSVEASVAVTQNMLSSLNKSMFDKIGKRYNPMGIWQPVTMEISPTGGRIADVFFQPALDGHTIEFTMENPDPNMDASGALSYTITNKKSGRVIASETVRSSLNLPSGKSQTFSISKDGLNPELWSPDHPNLYLLDVRWESSKGKVIHTYHHQVGYRTVATKGEQVYLNGKPYWSRGANMPPYGYKPNDEQTARGFLQLMHDGNTVITRSHGNPWNNMWFTAADEIGVGVSLEGSTWALLAKNLPPEASIEHWKNETLEIVRQYRNHPSILFYVISNEGIAHAEVRNPEKLAIYKDIIEDVRAIDPSRLIFQTSGNPDHQNIADIQDVHSYWDWYMPSSFVYDYTKPMSGLTLQDGRPFMNQECAIPYSMIDDGSVHPSYIGRYCAQSWVGDLGVHGQDKSYFQEHIRATGKLKAEKLRYSRSEIPTAGVMLFSNVTWIQHALSKPVDSWKPFPVYHGVKEAYQPVLVGLTTTQYVFYAGQQLNTNLFVVNDDTQATDHKNLRANVSFTNKAGKALAVTQLPVGNVAYYQVKKIPVQIEIPANHQIKGNAEANIKVELVRNDGTIISTNHYPIRLASKVAPKKEAKALQVGLSGCKPELSYFLRSAGFNVSDIAASKAKKDVIIIGAADAATTSEEAEKLLKPGGRLIVLGQGSKAYRFLEGSDVAVSVENGHGEFVEMLGWKDRNPVFAGLNAMDWKWWAQGEGKPAYVISARHRLDATKKNVIALGRYLPPHAYWSGDWDEIYKKTLSYPVFAVNQDWGQVVVCELMIENAVAFDPRAGQTIVNLITAAIEK